MKANTLESQELIQSVLETLAQLSDGDYTRKVPIAFNASIGGHYRHCLDHFRSLLDSAMDGDLNYDHRERDTLIEKDRFAALNSTRELRENYERLDPMFLMRSLVVTCKTSYSTSGSQASPSTIGREIMYSVAHAVHHYALIGVMGAIMGLRMPPGFGVAPSTLKHQAEAAKATTSLAGLPLNRINPFRLIGVYPATGEISEWRWNLSQLVRKRHRWKTLQWISSGFDEPTAQRLRGKTFQRAGR